MKIQELNSVQEIIQSYIEEQEALGNRITYHSLASALRVQKSYFSKLMAGGAQFTRDHGHLLSNLMGLDKDQKSFLSLLIDRDRAGIKQYQEELNAEIKELRHLYTKSEDYLNKQAKEITTEQSQLYYLYPETQLVHLSFALPQFQILPEKVKMAFNLSDEFYQQIIKILLDLNLVEISKNEVKLIQSNLHLPKDSPFFHQWQLQMKLKGLELIKALPHKDKYNFTVSFTASDEDKEKIRLEFMKYLNKVETIVKESESENLFQMNFDLFKWV